MNFEELQAFVGRNPMLSLALVGLTIAIIVTEIARLFRGYRALKPAELTRLINSENALVIDLSPTADFEKGHIAGSLNVDVTSPDFVQRVQQQVPKGKTIALYCRSGRRSKMAAAQLLKQGYKIIELESGILGWMSQQLPVSKD